MHTLNDDADADAFVTHHQQWHLGSYAVLHRLTGTKQMRVPGCC